jgi:hypothetical protein
VFTAVQLYVTNKNNRRVHAREFYRDYLKAAIERPHLSLGQYDSQNPLEEDQYDTFVSLMLYAFDEAIVAEGIAIMEGVIEYQVSIHHEYLKLIFPKDRDPNFSIYILQKAHYAHR